VGTGRVPQQARRMDCRVWQVPPGIFDRLSARPSGTRLRSPAGCCIVRRRRMTRPLVASCRRSAAQSLLLASHGIAVSAQQPSF